MQIVAAPSDAEPARTLLGEYFAERAEGFRDSGGYRIVSPDPAAFTAPDGAFLVLIGDEGLTDRALGCGGVRRIEADAHGARFEIKHLYVRPAARGHGGGRALLGALEARALALGAAAVVLDTNASLEAAGALYRRHGYRAIEPYNTNPNATDWFEKRLGRPADGPAR